MIKKISCIILLFFCSIFLMQSYGEPGQIINVSTGLANNTSNSWGNMDLSISISYPGITQSINIDPNQASSVGRYVATLPLGSAAIIEVDFFDPQTIKKVSLCQIKVEAVSTYHALMTQIRMSTQEKYTCEFTGNPDDNSAQILIQNNRENKK